MTQLALELKQWMEMDVAGVFERFLAIASPERIARGEGDMRFLYLPGRRADRVVLLAHADTVWDAKPGYPAPVRFADGRYTSGSPELGIGADDRAGCALLWELRGLGHSLLLTSGEEKGCIASRWLAAEHPELLATLNAHRFMVQFDRRNAAEYKCYEVGSDAFRACVEQQTGYREPDRLRGTDIKQLCTEICGVNLSCGYHDEHTPAESLVFAEWEQTLRLARAWLAQTELPRFTRGG